MQVVPLLSVMNLRIDRGDYRAIEGVSFDVKPGSRTVIIGPNGAGKSSLIQAILGLIPHNLGGIKFAPNVSTNIGYIPQKFPFDRGFPLSVWEMVSLGIKGKVSAQNIRNALTQVGLEHKAKNPIGVLSGGELKRMLLAHCLVMCPKLLILDEAMAGVDAAGELAFGELLTHLRLAHNWTILEVSHNLNTIENQADWVICLNRSVVMQGTPQEILNKENLTKLYGQPQPNYCHHHQASF